VNTNSVAESPIRIFVLEQHRLLRQGLVHMVRRHAGLTVVGHSKDCTAESSIEELTMIPCDALLLTSLETLQAVRQRAETTECLQQVKVVMFGMDEEPENFLQALRLGACGYLLNDTSAVQMVAAVRSVAQGEAVCPPKLCRTLFEHFARGFLPDSTKEEPRSHSVDALTCRQRQLMALVAKGMTNK
jgi:two-component system, NarL family, response regulator DevR